MRVQHVGSFCFRAINTFEQPQLESQTSQTNSPTVNGLCYQLCKVPTTNSNCGQASSPSPSSGKRAPLKQLCKFSIYVSACHGGHTHQAAGRLAGWQSIRIDSFIDFCHFLVLFAFSASAGTQPARQAGSQVAHPPCCPVNRDRQLQTRRGNATSAAGNVWPHTRTHTHTHVHTYGNVYLICILPFDG